MSLTAPEVIKIRSRQEPLWSTPPAAALGELLERLALWAQVARGRRFELRHGTLLVTRRTEAPQWWLDLRMRNKVVATFVAATPGELARDVATWLDAALGRQVKP